MSIGVGIFLMVVGGVLAFAVQDSWDAVNLQVVGYILLLAGLAGILLSFYITNRRRRVDTDAIDPAVEEEYRVVEEHHRDISECPPGPSRRRTSPLGHPAIHEQPSSVGRWSPSRSAAFVRVDH